MSVWHENGSDLMKCLEVGAVCSSLSLCVPAGCRLITSVFIAVSAPSHETLYVEMSPAASDRPNPTPGMEGWGGEQYEPWGLSEGNPCWMKDPKGTVLCFAEIYNLAQKLLRLGIQCPHSFFLHLFKAIPLASLGLLDPRGHSRKKLLYYLKD